MKSIYCLVFLFCIIHVNILAKVNIDFSYNNLEKLILSKHPSIRNSQYNIDIAEDQKKQAMYGYLPRINFTLGGFPIAPYLYNSYNNGLIVEWDKWQPVMQVYMRLAIPVYDFGRTKNYSQAADHNITVSQAQLEITKNAIISQVKRLYWGYLSYNSYKKYIFDVTLPKFEEIVEEQEKDFEKGKISRNSLESSRMEYLDMKQNLLNLYQQKKNLDTQLGLLLDASTDEEIDINFQVKYIYTPTIDLKPYSHYLELARNNSPALVKLINESLAANYYTEAQKANIWPIIAFGLNISYTMLDEKRPQDWSSGVYPDSGFKFGFGFTLDWNLNIWDSVNKYDMAKKSSLKLQESMKFAIQELESKLKESYDNLVHAKTILSYQEEILAIAQRNLIFTNKAYSTDTATSDDIKSTVRTLFSRLQNYYNQMIYFDNTLANFENLLGTPIVDYQNSEIAQVENEILLSEGA